MLTEESFVDFHCPYCGEPVSFPLDHGGTAQACPTCNESVIVPERSGDPGGKIPLPTETGRLILRRFAAGDWKDLLQILGHEELFQYVEGGPLDEDAVLNWLQRDQHVRFTTPGQPIHVGIELKEGNRLIGFGTLHFVEPERRQVQFDLLVSPEFQKQGIGLEAAEATLGLCFDGLKMHRVSVSFNGRNEAARKLAEKLGLRREGAFLKNRLMRGMWTDTVFYAALAEEWSEASKNASQP